MEERARELGPRRSFDGEDFGGLDLSTRDLSSSRFHRCSFAGADLRHSTLDRCSFTLCDFSRADLRGASLRGAGVGGCSFDSADLRDADLRFTRVGRVNTGDPPHGVSDFSAADLTGARLDDVVDDGSTLWPPGFAPPS